MSKEPMCLQCAETGHVVEHFQNEAGESDESSDFCECPTGQRYKAQLAAAQEMTRARRLASQVAHLGATGLCFLTPDGTDYSFSAAGIEAAARDAGWHYGKIAGDSGNPGPLVELEEENTDEERDPLNGELISATVPGHRELSVRCSCGHSKAAHSQGGCIGLMDNVHDICPCESFLGKT